MTGAYFTEYFARQKRLNGLTQELRKVFREAVPLEERAEAARDWARQHNERRRRAAEKAAEVVNA